MHLNYFFYYTEIDLSTEENLNVKHRISYVVQFPKIIINL